MRIKRIVIFVLLLCLHVSFFSSAEVLKGEEKFETYSYEDIVGSVGYITLSSNSNVRHISTTYIIHQDKKYSYIASSYVTSSSGYVKKAHFGNTNLDIELVGADETIDLAVFKFDRSLYDAPVLKMASSSYLRNGEYIFYVGLVGTDLNNANVNVPVFSKEQTFVSKTDVVYCKNKYLYDCTNLMLIDSELSSFSQGGPIFNAYGYVVGMVSMYNPVSDLENGDELYHGTLSNDINVFLNRILKHDLSRADLGLYIDKIEDLSIEKQKHLKLNINRGTIITAVKNNASLSGIGTDYVITKINGKRVETLSELVSEMYKYNERTIIKVTARKTNGSTETYYIKG